MKLLIPLLLLAGAAAAEPRILMVGDSFLAWLKEEGESVADAMADALGEPVVNRAVSGALFLDEIPDQYVDGDWDWVVATGGANDLSAYGCDPRVLDALLSPDGTEGAIAEAAMAVGEEGIRLLWIFYHDLPDAARGTECVDQLFDLADRLAAMAAALDHVALVDGREVIDRTDLDLYDPDLIHPSDQGARLLGAAAAAAIRAAE